MGKMLAFVAAAIAMGGAAYFLLGGDTGTDSSTDPDSYEYGDIIDDTGSSKDEAGGPTLSASGSKDARTPAGPAAYRVIGRVLDADGKPLGDVAVVARRTGNAWNPQDPSSYQTGLDVRIKNALDRLEKTAAEREPIAGETRSAADGTFALPLHATGRYRVNARPAAPQIGTNQSVSLYDGQLEEDTTLTVLEGTTLQGRVLDEADLGVEATLTASWRGNVGGTRHSWTSEPVASGRTDGAFAFEAVPVGTVSLSLLLPGGRKLSGISVETPHEGDFIVRVASGGGAVEGLVSDANGTPVPGAMIAVSVTPVAKPGEQGVATSTKAVAGDDGRYRVENVPPGKVATLQAIAQGFLPFQDIMLAPSQEGREIVKGETLTFDIKLSRGGSVAGRVTLQGSDRAIAGAEVTLYPSRGPGATQVGGPLKATTDAGGRYSFDKVPKGRYIALAKAEGHFLPQLKPRGSGNNFITMGGGQVGPGSLTVVVTAEGKEATRDLELARGYQVTGRVVDAGGGGVAGAEIFARGYNLQQMAWQWGIGSVAKESLATSQTDGSFTCEGLPPNADWVFFAKKQGYVGVYGQPLATGPEAKPATVKLELQPGATLRGVVIDSKDKPLAGMQVSYWGQTQETAGDKTSTKTGTDGTFELTSVPAGNHQLNVWAQGRQGKQLAVSGLTAGEVREGLELKIAAGVEISGVIVDKDGVGISGLNIMWRGQTPGGGWHNTTTGQDGSFTLHGVSEGRGQLYTYGAAGQQPVGTTFTSPAKDLRFEFARPTITVITGEVLDADGKPVPLCSVQVSVASAGRAGMRGRLEAPNTPGSMGGPGGGEVVNGAFQRTVTGEGPWQVTASNARDDKGNSLNLQLTRVEVPDAGEKIIVRMERGEELRGVVVDEKGKGIADVMVRVNGAAVQTDAKGVFLKGGLTKGKVTVQVTQPAGYIRPKHQSVDVPGGDVRFDLRKGMAISGRAFGGDDKPLTQGWVTAMWTPKDGSGSGHANAQLKTDGSFRVDGIPDDVLVKLTIQVWNQGGGSAVAPKTIEDVRPGTADLEVRMGAGLTIEGTVLGQDGKPVAGTYVYGRSKEGRKQTGYVMVDEKGGFKLTGLEAGTYTLQVMNQGGGAAPAPIDVVAPARGILIKMPRSASLAGKIMGFGDSNPRFWQIRIVSQDGKNLGHARMNQDGTWSANAIADEGRVWVCASSHQSDKYAMHGPVSPGSADVTLTLRTGASIQGSVEGVPEASRGRVRILAKGARGWQAYAGAGKDGSYVVRGLPEGDYEVTASTYDGKLTSAKQTVRAGAKGVVFALEAK